MSQDPENRKGESTPFRGDAHTGGPSLNYEAASTKVGSTPTPLLADHQALVDRLFAESGGRCWGLTRDRFELALEVSARKNFRAAAPTPQTVEEYLGALHLSDLALACSCAQGHAEAWEHFVATYRGYLRAAAAAILHCGAASPSACDLADSLFAELYGLTGGAGHGPATERSLFRYFHGRSSLKTWLRAILTQRHVDAIRAGRRFTELDAEDRHDGGASRQSLTPGASAESPPDPHRQRYVALFSRTLEAALGLLDLRDRERLRLYYAEQQTLAEIGGALGEHESSVSRNLERIRRELRTTVEESLRKGRVPANGSSAEPGLSEAEISLCLEYASEDAPIDLAKLFPGPLTLPPKTTRPRS